MPHFCDIYYCRKKIEERPQKYTKRLLEYGFENSFGILYDESRIQRSDDGKPYVDQTGVHFNISHGQRIVALACADTPVGVDVESERMIRDNTILKSCTPKEQMWLNDSNDPQTDFLKLWTLKESYVKMTGKGLRVPLLDLEFLVEDGKIQSNKEEGDFFQYELKEGILSICLQHGRHLWSEEELQLYELSDDLEIKMTDDKKVW